MHSKSFFFPINITTPCLSLFQNISSALSSQMVPGFWLDRVDEQKYVASPCTKGRCGIASCTQDYSSVLLLCSNTHTACLWYICVIACYKFKHPTLPLFITSFVFIMVLCCLGGNDWGGGKKNNCLYSGFLSIWSCVVPFTLAMVTFILGVYLQAKSWSQTSQLLTLWPWCTDTGYRERNDQATLYICYINCIYCFLH